MVYLEYLKAGLQILIPLILSLGLTGCSDEDDEGDGGGEGSFCNAEGGIFTNDVEIGDNDFCRVIHSSVTLMSTDVTSTGLDKFKDVEMITGDLTIDGLDVTDFGFRNLTKIMGSLTIRNCKWTDGNAMLMGFPELRTVSKDFTIQDNSCSNTSGDATLTLPEFSSLETLRGNFIITGNTCQGTSGSSSLTITGFPKIETLGGYKDPDDVRHDQFKIDGNTCTSDNDTATLTVGEFPGLDKGSVASFSISENKVSGSGDSSLTIQLNGLQAVSGAFNIDKNEVTSTGDSGTATLTVGRFTSLDSVASFSISENKVSGSGDSSLTIQTNRLSTVAGAFNIDKNEVTGTGGTATLTVGQFTSLDSVASFSISENKVSGSGDSSLTIQSNDLSTVAGAFNIDKNEVTSTGSGTATLTVDEFPSLFSVASFSISENKVSGSGDSSLTIQRSGLTVVTGAFNIDKNEVTSTGGTATLTVGEFSSLFSVASFSISENKVSGSGDSSLTIQTNSLSTVEGAFNIDKNEVTSTGGTATLTVGEFPLLASVASFSISENKVSGSGDSSLTIQSNRLSTVAGAFNIDKNEVTSTGGSGTATLTVGRFPRLGILDNLASFSISENKVSGSGDSSLTISNFPELITVTGDFSISDNLKLMEINGFNKLIRTNKFSIDNNIALTAIAAFKRLMTVTVDFSIADNPQLVEFMDDAFMSLATVNGIFTLKDNILFNDCCVFKTVLADRTKANTVIMNNAMGCDSLDAINNGCIGQPLVTITAEPIEGISPLSVDFAANVTDGDPPFTYAWDFGDGNTSIQQNPTHIYATAGVYNATVVVTDADGDTASASIEITVMQDSTPVITELTAAPAVGIAPLTVAFIVNATGGNPPLTYAWNFSDGNTSDLQNPTHIYATAGSYNATVVVTDADGDEAIDGIEIIVMQDSVLVVFGNAEPTEGIAPLEVVFDAVVAGGNPPVSYAWDFGDSNASDLQNPTHIYETAGTFNAVVVVTDADGDEASDSIEITVMQDSTPVITELIAAPAVGIAPLTVAFDAFVAGGNFPLTFLWDFGDGNASDRQNTTHIYATAGSYNATVVVTDADGDEATDSVTVTVVLFIDNFEYGPIMGPFVNGDVANGVGVPPWSAHSDGSSNNLVQYITSNLSMTGYPSSGIGGSVTIASAAGEDVSASFTEQTSGVIYFSALVSLLSVSTAGDYFLHLKDLGTNFRALIGAKSDGSGGVLFGIGASSDTLTYGTTSFTLNTTYLLVATYDIDIGESKLYVLSEVVGSEPAIPEASNTGTAVPAISHIAIRQSTNTPSAQIDGIRVAGDWNGIMND